MKKSFLQVLLDQRKPTPAVVTTDLSGKTVVVVGANTGIGYEAAKHFTRMNPARVIMACRNKAKGETALAKIEAETGYKNAELWLLDLANFSSVLEFVDKFEKDGGRLDLLVANAGIAATKHEATTDGWESTLQVNDLATSLLCLLLLPRLVHTAREYSTTPRLVVVASDVHYLASVPTNIMASPKILEALSDKKYCTSAVMRSRYPLSKLLNVFFVRALTDHLAPSTPIIVDAVNPGFCVSDLQKREEHYFIVNALFDLLQMLFAHTSEEGSRSLVWAAVGGQDDEEKLRGAFVWNSEIVEVSDYVLSAEGEQAQARIWTETLEILEKVSPKIRSIADEYLSGGAEL